LTSFQDQYPDISHDIPTNQTVSIPFQGLFSCPFSSICPSDQLVWFFRVLRKCSCFKMTLTIPSSSY
jgi:hypothetical protein